MMIVMDMLELYVDAKTIKIGILNNRYDRERRAEQFSDVAANDLQFDWLITFGAYEDLVTHKLISNGFPAEMIINLGFRVNPTLEQITRTIAGDDPRRLPGDAGRFCQHPHPPSRNDDGLFRTARGNPGCRKRIYQRWISRPQGF